MLGKPPIAAAQQTSGLFVEAAGPAASAAARQATPERMRSRTVTIDFSRLGTRDAAVGGGRTLLLNLFDDVSYEAVLDRVDPTSGGFVWVGHIAGIDMSTVSLASDDGVMSGLIQTPDATYSVQLLRRRPSFGRTDRPERTSSRRRTSRGARGPCTGRRRHLCAAGRRRDDRRRAGAVHACGRGGGGWAIVHQRADCQCREPDQHVVREQRRRATHPAGGRRASGLYREWQFLDRLDQPHERGGRIGRCGCSPEHLPGRHGGTGEFVAVDVRVRHRVAHDPGLEPVRFIRLQRDRPAMCGQRDGIRARARPQHGPQARLVHGQRHHAVHLRAWTRQHRDDHLDAMANHHGVRQQVLGSRCVVPADSLLVESTPDLRRLTAGHSRRYEHGVHAREPEQPGV